MADLDPALIEKAARSACDTLGRPPCSYPKCSCGAKNFASLAARAALLSLGIPAAALNALAKGEAVVVPKVRTREMIAATPFLEDSWDAQLAASPYRSEP